MVVDGFQWMTVVSPTIIAGSLRSTFPVAERRISHSDVVRPAGSNAATSSAHSPAASIEEQFAVAKPIEAARGYLPSATTCGSSEAIFRRYEVTDHRCRYEVFGDVLSLSDDLPVFLGDTCLLYLGADDPSQAFFPGIKYA